MTQDFGSRVGRRAGFQLLAMGVLWLVIAGGLYLVLGSDPFAGDTIRPLAILFAVIGLVMVLVSVFLFRRSGGRARVAAEGLAGTARIMGLSQTGMSLNDQPQIGMDLQVSALGLGTYQVEHKEFVPLLLLSRLQPGALLAVKVNRANPKQIVIDWNAAPAAADVEGTAPASATASMAQVSAALSAAGLAGAGVAAPFATPDQSTLTIDQLRAWLKENGLEATARIDRLEDSGQTIGTDRLFTMQTTLQVPGRPPFRGPASAAMVPLDKVGRIAVGVVLPVKVAPDNPDLTMFEWDRV